MISVFKVSADLKLVAPNEVDLVTSVPDSVQMTMHNNKPIIMHRRTPTRMQSMRTAQANKQPAKERLKQYTASSIANL